MGECQRTSSSAARRRLQQIVRHASRPGARGLLLLLAPPAGVSELLRQSFDELFNQRGRVVPIYFALTRNDVTAVEAARQFFQTFIRQCVAFRRNDPALCESPLTLNDLVELAAPPGLRMDRATGRVV